jgi:hypothetical protein
VSAYSSARAAYIRAHHDWLRAAAKELGAGYRFSPEAWQIEFVDEGVGIYLEDYQVEELLKQKGIT